MKSLDYYILAVDHGTSGIKTSLINLEGHIFGTEFEPVETLYFPDGGFEQDPEAWWSGFLKTAKGLLTRKIVPVHSIIAICCSSMFSTTVAVDSSGFHLANALLWLDCRGSPYIRRMFDKFPKFLGYHVPTALQWVRKTGGGPQLSGKDDCAHVLFWKHEQPALYQKAAMFLGAKDYLNARLTGNLAAGYDAMSLFWVINSRDIKNLHYDQSLISLLGIDRAKLPPLLKSIDVLGTVKREITRELGISESVKVIVGSPDHQSAAVGAGAIADYDGYIYIGTSSWIQCHTPIRKTDMVHSIAALPSAIPGKYYCVNEQDQAGGCLDFFLSRFAGIVQSQEDFASEVGYQLIDQLAEQAPPGSNQLLFLPWLHGERTPVDNPDMSGGFINLGLRHTRADIARALLEGVAFNSRWSLFYIERFLGRSFESLKIVGGGALSAIWCQIFADILQRPIYQVTQPRQTNARGAAFIAAVGLGFIQFDDIPRLVNTARVFEPDRKMKKRYDAQFNEFVKLYQSLRKSCARLKRI